jgi:hypothetical protein
MTSENLAESMLGRLVEAEFSEDEEEKEGAGERG